jgi:hypothetical protein
MFVAKLNPDGNALEYSTYLAGNYYEGPLGLVTDEVGDVYVTGQTGSTNFPVISGLPTDQGGVPPVDTGDPFGPPPCAFISKLNANGDALALSTYLCANNTAEAIVRAGTGNIYVAGVVTPGGSFSFPVVGGLPPDQGGSPGNGTSNGFITQITEHAPLLSFQRTHFDVLQSDGAIEVSVIRSGRADDAVTVDFATSDGTAIEGTDYVSTNGTLSWAVGDNAPKTITITILPSSAGDQDFHACIYLKRSQRVDDYVDE